MTERGATRADDRLSEAAIHSAADNGFVQNEALAYELASSFHRARARHLIANTYLCEARACYVRWGAEGKVGQIDQLHPRLLGIRSPVPSTTFVARSEHLDLLSVAKASQTISSETEMEKLVGTLLQVVLGVTLALLLNRPFRGKGLVRSIFLLPMVATPVAIALVWMMMYNPTLGVMNYLVGLVGLGPYKWVDNAAVVIPPLVGHLSTAFLAPGSPTTAQLKRMRSILWHRTSEWACDVVPIWKR